MEIMTDVRGSLLHEGRVTVFKRMQSKYGKKAKIIGLLGISGAAIGLYTYKSTFLPNKTQALWGNGS